MALTRSFLKGMNLTDEQVGAIIEAHTETVDGLKGDLTRYKADAAKLPAVQKELDGLKAAKDDGYEQKYNDVKKEFDDYKTAQTAKEARAAKEAAAKAYYEEKGIVGKNLEIALRGSSAEISALELENGSIKDAAPLDALIGDTFAALVSTTKEVGAKTATPPAASGGGFSRADIYKKDDHGRYMLSASERQKALMENQIT